jgi:hypothetical protein
MSAGQSSPDAARKLLAERSQPEPMGMTAESPQSAKPQQSSRDQAEFALQPESQPTTTSTDSQVWPERQIISLGEVSSDSPGQLVEDEGGLAEQGSFGAYERLMARADHGPETAGVHHMPGRLLEGPRLRRQDGFTDSETPAEAMRRFDRIRELRQMIGELQAIPVADRTADQANQLPALWYQLGVITGETTLVDSAIQVMEHQVALSSGDDANQWISRRDELIARKSQLSPR